MITFFVPGVPVPKQSFRYSSYGHYQPDHLIAWQDEVRLAAKIEMQGREPHAKSCFSVSLVFHLPDRRRRDLDNLSKAVLDSCNGIIWKDDDQVLKLKLEKYLDKYSPGVAVEAEEI